MDIELETVRAGLQAEIERGESILRTERAAAAVRQHEGTPEVKERHVSLG